MMSSPPPNMNHVISQLEEITGVSDRDILLQAIEKSRTKSGEVDVSKGVNLILDRDDIRQLQPSQAQHSIGVSTICEGQEVTGESSFTNKEGEGEESDLIRAIALSLQEAAQSDGLVSREERDINTALEQSLHDTRQGPGGQKRKRPPGDQHGGGSLWMVPEDIVNPNERKRDGLTPVGLRNTNLNCWFNAVAQALFHLPYFRKMVLSKKYIDKDSKAHHFMSELRVLFAHMLVSKRKYVDPHKAMEILKEMMSKGAEVSVFSSQQDVSECLNKLLDWLEESFKDLPANVTVGSGNPVEDLFFGKYKVEGFNNGVHFTNTSKFGQYPVNVVGCSDIHQGLEGSMLTRDPNNPSVAAQEVGGTLSQLLGSRSVNYWDLECVVHCDRSVLLQTWFTKLPPVLILDLVRFQFNHARGRGEKIHDRFTFPDVINMDRVVTPPVRAGSDAHSTSAKSSAKSHVSRHSLSGGARRRNSRTSPSFSDIQAAGQQELEQTAKKKKRKPSMKKTSSESAEPGHSLPLAETLAETLADTAQDEMRMAEELAEVIGKLEHEDTKHLHNDPVPAKKKVTRKVKRKSSVKATASIERQNDGQSTVL